MSQEKEKRITLSIPLREEEYSALDTLAREELRTPEDQILYILRTALYDLGLLQSQTLFRSKKRRPLARPSAAQAPEENDEE